MHIEEIRSIPGPNLFHNKSILIMTLDLEDRAETSSDQIPGFNDRLLKLLPGLQEHRCSKGYAGGFVERLHTGTYLAHIIEHIALEMSQACGIGVGFGKTIYGEKPGLYRVIVRYRAEKGMKFLLETAVDLADALAREADFPLEEKIQEAKVVIGRTDLGPSTRALVDAAEKRGIPWLRLNDMNLVQLGYGKHRRLIQAAVTDHTSLIASEIASNKDLTKKLLHAASIPVPDGKVASSLEETLLAFRHFHVPVVIKPLDGHHGKGVSLELQTEQEVRDAFQVAIDHSDHIVIEEFFVGRDFRVLIVGGKYIAAAERIPAHVVGDGKKTLFELVEIENLNPLRGEGHGFPLTRIQFDEVFLRRKGISSSIVPEEGKTVILRETANLSTGGTARDVTDEVHSEVRLMCERAARAIGLDVCGIDLVLKDISRPILPHEANGIIEVNAGPGLRMHHYPSEGKPRDVGGAIIDYIFPAGAPSRIPIISITGTNGKTTVTRMIGHILSQTGNIVGMTTSDGIYIGDVRIERGDTTGPISARTVLSDSMTSVAVLETARGGIIRAGLAYDWSDIGVLTNIQTDHFGQDGIKDLDDLLYIKALVAERVREGGTVVLNADDEKLMTLLDGAATKPPKKVALFSMRDSNAFIKQHAAKGQLTYFLRNGWIVETADGIETPILSAFSLPTSYRGTAQYNIANAMAAIAACRAFGTPIPAIVSALMTFKNNSHNQGRGNLYRINKGYLLLDYGHNPQAIQAVSKMVSEWKDRRATCILGLPGDREDQILEQSARIVAKCFERVIVREDSHLRGRKPGELASFISTVLKANSPSIRVSIILDERNAIRTALKEMDSGEVIVLFYDELLPVMETLKEFNAEPIEDFDGRSTLMEARTEWEQEFR